MKRGLFLVAIATGLAGWFGVQHAAADKEPASGGKAMFKAVVHINFDDADRQKHGLKNVANMLNEVKSGDIEVVCHGDGVGLLVKEKTKHADEVAALLKQGVRFAACENTLKDKSIPKEDLLPGVTTVPSGAVEVVRKQQDGFGYFRP
jgi:intracellular sulfur oxidation DsrE/DsrF family protein